MLRDIRDTSPGSRASCSSSVLFTESQRAVGRKGKPKSFPIMKCSADLVARSKHTLPNREGEAWFLQQLTLTLYSQTHHRTRYLILGKTGRAAGIGSKVEDWLIAHFYS